MNRKDAEKVKAWQVLLLIFIPFVGAWFFMGSGKPKAAQYLTVAYSILIGLSALSAYSETDILSGMFFFMVCILPVLYFVDNRVLERRARRQAEIEELDAHVKDIIENEPMMSKDDSLEDLERKYS